jgi:MFS family permease
MAKPVILRNNDFLLLWMGQCLSQAGTRMYQIAIVWWILGMIKGEGGAALGLFLVVGALPSILLVKYIGTMVDRHKSKSILVLVDIFSFVVVGIVGWAIQKSLLTLPMVYFAGLLVALGEGFYNPTLNKAVPELVPEKDVEEAVAFQTSTQYLASFGGAVAGALLIGKLGIPMVVFLNALSYLLSAGVNYFIAFRYAAPPVPAEEVEAQGSGWALLRDLPVLKKILLGFGLVNFFATPTLVILPIYTKATLGADASVLGALEAALWIGLLAGTFSSGWFAFVKSTIKLGAFCLFALGFCLFAPGLFINILFYIAMLFVAGFFLGINNVKFVSLFQCVVEPSIKGRFFALMNALISFTFPIAYLLFGILADMLTAPRVCVIQGFGVMAIALYFGGLARHESELYKPENQEAISRHE